MRGPRSWGCWLGGARLLCLDWREFSADRKQQVDRGWARRQLATLRFGPQHGICMLRGLPRVGGQSWGSAWEWLAAVMRGARGMTRESKDSHRAIEVDGGGEGHE